MLSTLAVATLLTLTDPPGDAVGAGTLSTPTATAMRDREAFDVERVSVPDGETFALTVGLGRAPDRFPPAILEFYLSDTASEEGTVTLLPGSGMRLPEGERWLYAVRMVGDSVQLFEGRSGEAVQVTAGADVVLKTDGTTLSLTTSLPLPRHFSLYGVAGSYDPFSQTGWRQLRETLSPWGYAGTQSYPVLDVVAENATLQTQALTSGVLPEIRASFSESGWLLLSGAGVVLALGGLAARLTLGQRGSTKIVDAPQEAALPSAPPLETPLAPFDVRGRLEALAALGRGDAQLIAPEPEPLPEPESVMG